MCLVGTRMLRRCWFRAFCTDIASPSVDRRGVCGGKVAHARTEKASSEHRMATGRLRWRYGYLRQVAYAHIERASSEHQMVEGVWNEARRGRYLIVVGTVFAHRTWR